MLFFMTTILGSLIAIASYSWLSMWIGLEINLLSIIPLLKSQKSLYPTEAILKYFITQALASTILMFSIIVNMNLESLLSFSNTWSMIIMNSALLTKMGAAPFHTWFPEVMEGLNWSNSILMLTWQKIAPMILFSYNLQMTSFISFVIITSSVISGILGLNQTSLRKIMAYSSINHIGWMIASMLSMKMMWMFYFLIYSTISLNIIIFFQCFNIFTMKQLFMCLSMDKLTKLLFSLNFLSLGGLPPFLGFFPKWLVINNLVENNFISLSMILIIFTLITLFFYLRLMFPSLTLTSSETITIPQQPIPFLVICCNSVTLLGLFICTLTFNLF
uniref:NADH-ubiquinone oxidoreductase chain 2 n=1 Tax=Phratora vulgatissima TaxID=878366 RepID=A0A1P8NN23_9CUCU|nr:NADH dehydrogenase subunit 2 [Phratora vulgatissima]